MEGEILRIEKITRGDRVEEWSNEFWIILNKNELECIVISDVSVIKDSIYYINLVWILSR